MKNLFLILLCCVVFVRVQAQKILLSDKTEFNIRTDDFSVIGKYKKSILVYRKRNGRAEVIFYNDKMVIERSQPLDMLPDHFSNIRFFCTNESLLVFYETKEGKKQNLYGSKLHADQWLPPLMLSSKPAGFLKDNQPFHYAISENHQRIMFYTSYFLSGDNTVQLVIVDDQLNILKQISQLFSDKEYYIADEAAVSDNGIPYLLATDKSNNRSNFEELKVLSVSGMSKDLLVFPISLEKHYLNDLQIVVDNKNTRVYISAFFADGKYSNPRGVYFSTFDEKSQSTGSIHFIPLALQISRGNADLKDIKMRNMFVKTDGGIEIVAEKYYQNVRTLNSINPIMNSTFVTGPDNSRTVTEYYYDEIYVFNFKIEGALSWSQTILKEQLTTDDGGIFSSFFTFRYPLGNAYIFNDLSTKNTRLLACYVSAKGEMNMKEIQTNEQLDDWSLMPRSAMQLSKADIVIPCVMKNYVSFLKLTF